jgi:integrase
MIKVIRKTTNPKVILKLLAQILDFSKEFSAWAKDQLSSLQFKPSVNHKPQSAPKVDLKPVTPILSDSWKKFVNWKQWTKKRSADNHRLFDNLLYFIGDKPVGNVTKKMLLRAFKSISRLPQRNKAPYKRMTLAEIVKLKIPLRHRISDKSVKEHLKLCQSLFSRYLVQEEDILKESPTNGIRLELEDKLFASLKDSEVRSVLDKSITKPVWFQWFLKIAVYSGARRAEIAGLRGADFKFCSDTKRYYFIIHEGKTKAAKRSVPVHQRLLDDGLMHFIGNDPRALLFPLAHRNPNRVTDLFGSLLDSKANELGERLVFHSVRHTFVTKARSQGVSTVLVQQVVGHEKSGGRCDR